MSDLLLKATPALLDGWCGPVVYDRVRWGGGYPPEPAVMAWLDASNEPPAAFVLRLEDRKIDAVPAHLVYLDLARAECRDRVARVVRDKRGKPARSTAPGPVTYRTIAEMGLDPHDDRCLPDGSRWVDAMALLLVAREVTCE